MSAVIRCEILGGTDIDRAFHDCSHIGKTLFTSVSCKFNGVEMFWTNNTTEDEWIDAYYRKIGKSREGKEAKDANAEAK